MTRKNWGLLIVLLVLGGVFGILLSQDAATTSLEVDADLFSVSDTAAIQRIVLDQAGDTTQVLEQTARGWQLNNAYRADPQLVKLLLSVLQNVEVKRPVAKTQQEEVKAALAQEGTRVQVFGETGILEEFYAGGVEEEQLSFFMQDDVVYVVELPGYANYISGIFTLDENNLRNRTIFAANHLNLQEIKVSYPEQGEEITIEYDGQNLLVQGVPEPDSTRLLGFLGLFENLQAVGYVNPQEYPELDSLLKQGPVAEITVKDLQHPEGKLLRIYAPAPGGRFRLGYLPEEQQAVLLDERLAQMLLINQANFSRKEE